MLPVLGHRSPTYGFRLQSAMLISILFGQEESLATMIDDEHEESVSHTLDDRL